MIKKNLFFCFLFVELAHCGVQISCKNYPQGQVPSVNISVFIQIENGNQDKSFECGGSNGPDDFPFYASIYIGKLQGIDYACAGALISPDLVLTSASCLDARTYPRNLERMLVYLGKPNYVAWDENVQAKLVKEIIKNPAYDKPTLSSDIALLRLTKSVKFTDQVKPICLWQSNVFPTTDGIVPGFDYDSSTYIYEILNSIKMRVAPFEKCSERLRGIGKGDTSFCATFTRREICKGDEGGPWAFQVQGKWYLGGVASFSIGYQSEVVCAPNYFSTFTNVFNFIDWIKNYMYN